MSPLDWLDRAFTLVHRLVPSFRRLAWLAGAPFAFLTVFVFYLERVEGVRSMRGFLALGLSLAWWWRTHWLGRASRLALMDLDPPLEAAPTSLGSLSLAGVAGVLMALALMPAALLAQAGLFGVVVGLVLALPVALFAPSWTAHAATVEQHGVGAWMAAFRDGASLRGSALLVHGFLLAGTILLFANLLAMAGLLLSAFQSLLGMEVAAVTSFMSFENDFAMVAVGTVVGWFTEPLRAALAVIALVHARSRRDGADLRSMVGALAEDERRRGRSSAGGYTGRAAILLVCFVVGAHPSSAQTPHQSVTGFEGQLPELGDEDRATEDQVRSVLSDPAFREFMDASENGEASGDAPSWLQRLMEALLRWLEDHSSDEASEASMGAPMSLPPPWVFVALATALLVAVIAFLWISRRRQQRTDSVGSEAHGAPLDPRALAPEQHLDEAAQLAARGLYRQAFRSLYLATLVALDRRGEINFDPARTNWHYLRQMGTSAPVATFRTFTQLFDRKWYGDEHTTRAEYEHGRALAASLATPHAGLAAAHLEPEKMTS